VRANFAKPLAGTFWSDLGVVYYGSLWPTDMTQFWFSAWLTNGQFGRNDVEWQQPFRPFSDNNDSKSYGARVVFSQEIWPPKGPDAMFSVGGSFVGGKYDDWDELYDWAAGVDSSSTWGPSRSRPNTSTVPPTSGATAPPTRRRPSSTTTPRTASTRSPRSGCPRSCRSCRS